LEQRAHAVANGYFVGTINRVGIEARGMSANSSARLYFCNPDGRIMAKGGETKDELIVATSTWTKSAMCGPTGSFTATGGRKCMGH